MTRIVVAMAMSASLLALTGCGNSDPAFADVLWQLQCPRGISGCIDSPRRSVFSFDGEEADDGTTPFVGCNVSDAPDVTQLVSLRAGLGTTFSFEIQGARVPRGGGTAIGVGCNIIIVDESTSYEGVCGAGNPSDTQPCQLSELTLEGSTIRTTLLCRNLTAPVDPVRFRRDLTNPEGEAVSVRFENCE